MNHLLWLRQPHLFLTQTSTLTRLLSLSHSRHFLKKHFWMNQNNYLQIQQKFNENNGFKSYIYFVMRSVQFLHIITLSSFEHKNSWIVTKWHFNINIIQTQQPTTFFFKYKKRELHKVDIDNSCIYKLCCLACFACVINIQLKIIRMWLIILQTISL